MPLSPDEIREILLLVALYCGIPAANEAHRAAIDVRLDQAGQSTDLRAFLRGSPVNVVS